jgi:hypothetical protein
MKGRAILPALSQIMRSGFQKGFCLKTVSRNSSIYKYKSVITEKSALSVITIA